MRQLAAIMFADMYGYTALMQQNEQLASSKRRRLVEVFESSMSIFNGKILQSYGDGILSIFSSAIDSVKCAIQIQQQLQKDPKVELRIGIHTGDVVVEGDVIYGDGVNLASRIESMAVPGGIFISEKVFDEIRNQENISAKELGYFEMKNVKNPIRLFAIANDGLVVPNRSTIKGKTKQPTNRLAVLPFVNMSTDPENEFFSDGITEELLNALTKVDGLQVTSRTSAFAFKGQSDDIREIALKLNVDKILEGSVRKAGNRVRITAQLINAADGYHIWSENYDRNLTDIFEVQDEISSIIANRLRENLTPEQHKEHLVKAPTQNMEAYTLQLKGLHFWNRLTPADARKAIDCWEKVIQLEPNYAQAYAMIAYAYGYLGASGQMKPDKAFDIVQKYSGKALQLDNTMPDVYIARAVAYLFFEWQWDEAYRAIQTAVQLNHNAVGAHQIMGLYYILRGQPEDAVNILERAVEVDPLSPVINQYLGEAYFAAERYNDAIIQAEKLLDMDPNMRIAIELKGWSVGMRGDWQKALELFEEVHRLTKHPLKGITPLGYAYAMLGQPDKAMECIHKMEQRQVEDPDSVVDGDLMVVWWALGEKEKVLHYAMQCIEKRMLPIYYMHLPVMRGVESEPWYADIRKKVGL